MSNKKDVNKLGVIGLLWEITPSFVKAAPGLFWGTIIISVCHGISWGVLTMMQQRFFDDATLLASKQKGLTMAFLSLALLGGAYVVCHTLNAVDNFLFDIMDEKIKGKLTSNIHNKMSRLAPIDFENTDKLDSINKAEMGKDHAMEFVAIIEDVFIFYLPYYLFMSWYLFKLKPILAISIILVFIPTALTQIIRTKVFSKLEDQSAPIRRENDYYEQCITNREYYKETRILGGFSYFNKLFNESLEVLQQLKYKATMKINIIEIYMRMGTVCGYLVILLILFNSLMKQQITVGAFAAVFTSITTLYNLMEELVYGHLGNVAQNMGAIKNYVSFLNLDERTGNRDLILKYGDTILENVSFEYPNSNKKAVDNINLTLRQGETIAVVGENGSGKSTLIRLITGLYLPTEGRVMINGIDTCEFSSEEIYINTSAVFQKYQRYQMSLRDNIAISKMDEEYDDNKLNNICSTAGVEDSDESFINGYDTMLSREFDGIDLSGGQWQRIAIARGFFRSHELIILDEPTAMIDPIEETRIYNEFAEIAKDKSAIIVTHRLGSVKLADRIIVMKEGKIVESGTHEELLSKGNEYSRLYVMQEQWYKEE